MKQAGDCGDLVKGDDRDARGALIEILKAEGGLERMRQLSAMRDARPHEALDALIQLMHSPDQAVRRRAGSCLSSFREYIGAREAELADMLQRHEDERVRLSCAIHLMPVHGAGVDQAYLAALRDPSEKVVQIACVEVGARAGAQAVEALAGVLEHASWRVRLEACKALITLNKADARVVSALERMSREPEAAVYDSECEGQGFKMEALVEFGEASGILRESEKDEITAELQREGWGTVDSILARARRIAGDLQ